MLSECLVSIDIVLFHGLGRGFSLVIIVTLGISKLPFLRLCPLFKGLEWVYDQIN